jgi:hypothetical protein
LLSKYKEAEEEEEEEEEKIMVKYIIDIANIVETTTFKLIIIISICTL